MDAKAEALAAAAAVDEARLWSRQMAMAEIGATAKGGVVQPRMNSGSPMKTAVRAGRWSTLFHGGSLRKLASGSHRPSRVRGNQNINSYT